MPGDTRPVTMQGMASVFVHEDSPVFITFGPQGLYWSTFLRLERIGFSKMLPPFLEFNASFLCGDAPKVSLFLSYRPISKVLSTDTFLNAVVK